MSRDFQYIRMIHSKRWVDLRRQVITEHPLCEHCEAEGFHTFAAEVHHIRPVEEASSPRDKEQRMFDRNNLASLCHACHVKAHVEIGRRSREMMMKRNAGHVTEVIERFFGV